MAIPLHCFLVTNLSNGASSASVARWLTLHNWTFNCTAFNRWTKHGRSSHIHSEWTHREHRLYHLFYCCVTSPRTHMLWALHSNGCTRHVSWHLLYCCVRTSPSNGWCLQFPLSNGSIRHNIIWSRVVISLENWIVKGNELKNIAFKHFQELPQNGGQFKCPESVDVCFMNSLYFSLVVKFGHRVF
jgi:hypothetical protein